MKLFRLPCLLLALVAISAAPVAQGELPTGSPNCAAQLFLDQVAAVPSAVESPAAEPFYLGAPAGKGPKSSTLTPSTTSSATSCEWYSIKCSNGTNDVCCGSASSCTSYCGEVCGEPCVYRPS